MTQYVLRLLMQSPIDDDTSAFRARYTYSSSVCVCVWSGRHLPTYIVQSHAACRCHPALAFLNNVDVERLPNAIPPLTVLCRCRNISADQSTKRLADYVRDNRDAIHFTAFVILRTTVDVAAAIIADRRDMR